MAKRVLSWRRPLLATLVAVEAAMLFAAALAFSAPASAQFFDGGFGGFWQPWGQPQRRSYRPQRRYQDYQSPYQERRSQQQDADYSKAPAPKKSETTPQMTVLVFGDSMADWLGYGLEQSFAESPEMGVNRKPRTYSGLIRQEVRSDPKGEHPDWPKTIRETLATEKPDFVVMMVGGNDRRQIREVLRPPPRPAAKPGEPATPDAAGEPKKPPAEGAPPQQANPAAPAQPGGEAESAATRTVTHEFRTEKWVELYIKRIDETIAALKSKGVPVFWVGLPPVRGARAAADYSFLNDLFRSRADKGGIVYVDIWDGFVDDGGNYALYGPDVDGQNRRLRAYDGTHFTQAGARKLAHFLERELQRWMTRGATPVALPVDEPPATKAPEPQSKPGAPAGIARPLSGPVLSLAGRRANEDDDTLLGGEKRQSQGQSQSPAAVDAIAAKVLLKGEPVPAPAGRADDFAWPRRDIAPVGGDPLVAIATLPMTPMKAEQRAAATDGPPAPSADAPGQAAKPAPGPGPRVASRPAQRQQTWGGGWFGGNGGWGWQQQQPQAAYRQQRSQPGFFPFLFRR